MRIKSGVDGSGKVKTYLVTAVGGEGQRGKEDHPN